MQTLRIGIIGLGGIATRMHIPALLSIPGVSILAGADRNPQQAERTQGRFRIPRVYGSYQKMFEEEELDAVYVCLPNALHGDATRLALERSLHVFCEKPMGHSAVEAMALAHRAQEQGRLLMPGYNMRYVPNYQRARNLIRSKRIGKILQIQCTMARPGPYTGWDPKSDWYYNADNMGVLYDQGSHAVDLIRFVCGVEITEAIATATTTLPGLPVTDSIVATLRTDHEAVGTLNLTWSACANLDMLVVHGTAGTVIASWNYFEHLKSSGGGVDKMMTLLDNAIFIVRRLSRSLAHLSDTTDPYLAISRDFVESVRTGASPQVTAQDGARALEALGMIASSLRAKENVLV